MSDLMVLEPPPPATIDAAALREQIVAALQTIYDPEIPVNIWELGLVYRVDVDADGDVEIDMTLTAPACPVAGEMPGQVQQKVQEVSGVRSAKVELLWEPPWDKSLMSEDARMALGF
jgi:FeS assembly SUF system protein